MLRSFSIEPSEEDKNTIGRSRVDYLRMLHKFKASRANHEAEEQNGFNM
jgi:hypothetical protein